MNSKRINNLSPYIPGEQPTDREYIKLNANENPFEPSETVISAISQFIKNSPRKLSLYPDPDSNNLRCAIANMLNRTGGVLCRTSQNGKNCLPSDEDKIPFEVNKDMIFTSNGSDEVLSFLFYAFFDSDTKVVTPQFSYSFYPVYAKFYNIPLDFIPLNNDWTLNKEEIVSHANNYNSPVIFANPNAPTALSISRNDIRNMILQTSRKKVFVVDEAYIDFGGESCIPLLSEFDNLIIVRTFSKSFCGAGIRIGYIVASPKIIQTITTVKNSFNHFPIDALSQVAGIASCESDLYYATCAKKIVATRNTFYNFLVERKWDVIPSSTNFLFAKKGGAKGIDLYKKIKEAGILVRHFDTKGIEDYIRITIGTDEQMKLLCDMIETL